MNSSHALHLIRLKTAKRRGFTLIELVMASMILVLVVGSVFATMNMGMKAMDSGTKNLDLYQNARVGMGRIQREMRNAVSPQSQWRPYDEYFEDDIDVNFGNMVQEERQGDIRFYGQTTQVSFVRKMYTMTQAEERQEDTESQPSLDLQEVRLFHDSESQEVRLEITRHLTEVMKAEWYYAQSFNINLNGLVIAGQSLTERRRYRRVQSEDEPLLEDLVGDIGWDGAVIPYMDHVEKLVFSYFGEDGWVDSWDSRQVIVEILSEMRGNYENYDPNNDIFRREKGLPVAVAVVVVLTNGDRILSYIDIPASSLNQVGAAEALRGLPSAQRGNISPEQAAGLDQPQQPGTEQPTPGPGGGGNESPGAIP